MPNLNSVKPTRVILLAIAASLLVTGVVHADPLGANPAVSGDGWTPRVPISALAQPLVGVDMSRLHVSNSFSFGSGFGGKAQGLQVTSLSYQFSGPLSMSVSVGNAFTGLRSSSGFFLEGLNLSYRASANTLFAIHFQNLRSPLQYGANGYNGLWPR